MDRIDKALQATILGVGVVALFAGAAVPTRTRIIGHPPPPYWRNLPLDDTGKAFYSLPPGARPVNALRGWRRFKHARASYAWRRHGRGRELIQFGSQVQHVVIIYMENRTPDNLFSGYSGMQYPPAFPGATFGQALDLANPNALPTLVPFPLEAQFDPNHGHQKGFVSDAQGNWNAQPPHCPVAGCPAGFTAYSHVPVNPDGTSEVQNYIALIENFAYASHVMQANEGPSFEAHQYAIAGQSGGWHETPSPHISAYVWAENPQKVNDSEDDPNDPDTHAPNAGGSCDTPNHYVQTLDITKPYLPNPEPASTPSPCGDYLTILDEAQTLPSPSVDNWQYIADSTTTIWSGPMAVSHLYSAYKNPLIPPAQQPFAVDPDAQNFVQSLVSPGPTSRPFAQLTYITPCMKESDHPNFNYVNGPQWLAYVVNAIGSSQYWDSTTIFVTWDDWGGWYDHYMPPASPPPAPPYSPYPPYHPWPNIYLNANDPYEWGFRVPLIVISPWVKSRGYVSTNVRSQSAILNFAETAFGLSSLSTDDAANLNPDGSPDDLSDMFEFGQGLPGKAFIPLPTPSFSPTPGMCPSAP